MDEGINLREFISVKGLKALGNRLTNLPVLGVELLEANADLEAQEDEKISAARQTRQGSGAAQLSLMDSSDEEAGASPEGLF